MAQHLRKMFIVLLSVLSMLRTFTLRTLRLFVINGVEWQSGLVTTVLNLSIANLGINANARASLHFYNTKEDVDYFIHALNDRINFFSSFKYEYIFLFPALCKFPTN